MSIKHKVNKFLYEKEYEHDACGIGFVANMYGKPSHQIVNYALTMLERMNHRGGTGSEPDSGDGAGVLLTIPDKFFRLELQKHNIALPSIGEYAVGFLFMPFDDMASKAIMKQLQLEIANKGFKLIWTRSVPYNFEKCGPSSQNVIPSFVQIFLDKPVEVNTSKEFEYKLFELRRHIETTFDDNDIYICSLSHKTIVYKGMLHAYQVRLFYPDLQNENCESKICLSHSRFSTNTFPAWKRAQPFRYLAHNGEINTLKGAENWMQAHKIEIYDDSASDSAKLENCMEYFYHGGRDIAQSLMMMIPESFNDSTLLDEDTKAFYEYATSFIAPWDGPAGIVFTDGDIAAATLDRNGLRPSRYLVTDDGIVVVASESGVVDIDPGRIIDKGVLRATNLFIVDTIKNKVYKNQEIKEYYTKQHEYRSWLGNMLDINRVPVNIDLRHSRPYCHQLQQRLLANGYNHEILEGVIKPMYINGEEPTISMGFDSPLSLLSKQPQILFTYFKQQFAQVTNPPIDAIREQMVVHTNVYLGSSIDLLTDKPENCRKLKLHSPILSNDNYNRIINIDHNDFKVVKLKMVYDCNKRLDNRLARVLDELFKQAEESIDAGANILVLNDEKQDKNYAVIPVLLAVSGLKKYLISQGKANKASIVVCTSQAYEVHHFACLIGFGASAIYPYLAYASLGTIEDDKQYSQALKNYQKAVEKGVVKIMSRMGISTVCGYYCAQLFEALGVSNEVIDKYFTGTVSRIGGITLKQIELEYLRLHNAAYTRNINYLPSGGIYQYKRDGEYHMYNPDTIIQFQTAVRNNDYAAYKKYVDILEQQLAEHPTTLRTLWDICSTRKPIHIDDVEPVNDIVKRFKVGAMSFGALSDEAHEVIAQAMNMIGAKSNSGEGGEDSARFNTIKNSRIKQVASGRFGVHAQYLASADEIQIKLAQGAKPGEGGQLPGNKVFPKVAEIRGSTMAVSLISPSPHHDIYSIEDLSQLIYDLKTVNPYAKISVKLVSSTGVGTVATGCVKTGADVVVISGYDGGTGASPRNSIRDVGLPWEIGLADAHQTLSLNNLRNRMRLEVDGKLMTGRDVVIAAMLGAEEYSFASLTLVAIGCVMMRVCSLNTCPVGIATQDLNLRKRFMGKPEHIINMMRFIAQDMREIMAKIGFKTIDELVGHSELLQAKFIATGKTKYLDTSRVIGHSIPITRKVEDPFIEQKQWVELDGLVQSVIANFDSHKIPFVIKDTINNTKRAVGARMGGWIASRYGNFGLQENIMQYEYVGIAGQSFGAFATAGMRLKLIGEANDYIAKGLSGATIIVVPPENAAYEQGKTHIVGNVACFGAIGGRVYFYGRAGERFCVRNSGAIAVCEGVGDNACEYMTGGVAVILGNTGRNFAAGMTGGVAYVYDEDGDFTNKCNMELVGIYKIFDTDGDENLQEIISDYYQCTGSKKAKSIIEDFNNEVRKFVKIYPKQFHKVMMIKDKYIRTGLSGDALNEAIFSEATGT